MPTHPQSESEKGPLGDGDCAQSKSDLAKELKHTKAGVWDAYEHVPHSKFAFDVPWISKIARNLEIIGDFPFFWRVVKDVIKMKSCRYYLCLYILVKILLSLEPAVALWYGILPVSSLGMLLIPVI